MTIDEVFIFFALFLAWFCAIMCGGYCYHGDYGYGVFYAVCAANNIWALYVYSKQ